MTDGDRYDVCCTCGTERLVRAMRQAAIGPPPLYQCERCHDGDHMDPWEFDEKYHGDDDYEPEECPHCNGTGEQSAGGLTMDCPECGGDGWEC